MHDFLVISHWPTSPEPCRGYGGRYINAGAALNSMKRDLRRKGWSYRSAAAALGVHWQHLTQVMIGRRVSARLLAAIHAVPVRKSA
jgi:hypothetical protein